jgi:hypothetical protein
MDTSWCNISLKKTLILPKILENKGLDFFLPPRSMVLKVVRGKILETLELSSRPTARSSDLELPVGSRPEPIVRLSKSVGYLIDNLCMLMLSG